MVEIKQVLRLFSLLILAFSATSTTAQGLDVGKMKILEEAIEAPLIEIIAQDSSFASISVRNCDTCPRRIFKSSADLEVTVGDRLLTKTSELEGRVGSGVVFYDPETEIVGRINFFE